MSRYTISELRELSLKEKTFWTDSHFQKIYEEATRKILARDKRKTVWDGIQGVERDTFLEAEAFAQWGKERSMPVYYVCENYCTVALTFSDLYAAEVER